MRIVCIVYIYIYTHMSVCVCEGGGGHVYRNPLVVRPRWVGILMSSKMACNMMHKLINNMTRPSGYAYL